MNKRSLIRTANQYSSAASVYSSACISIVVVCISQMKQDNLVFSALVKRMGTGSVTIYPLRIAGVFARLHQRIALEPIASFGAGRQDVLLTQSS